MLRRSRLSAFAPDAYVFPGGTVDPADFANEPTDRTLAWDQFRATIAPVLPSSEAPVTHRDAWGLMRAALRELHEEAGIGLSDPSDLVLFSHWITPPTEGRRYNTHFFIAQAPPDQIACADSVETHDGVWITAREALERSRAGSFYLVYPTLKHLERLSPYRTVDDVLAFARTKPIVTIMPDDSPARGFTMPKVLEDAW